MRLTLCWRSLLLALLALIAALPATSHADDLAGVKQRGTLVWGGDQEGGGPYVYPSDEDSEVIVGFEVDLAEALADYLEVEPEFFQADWDSMPDMLKAKKIDIMLNGYEWTPIRADAMQPSMPYYVYGLQLLVRKDDQSITSWDDLCAPKADGSKRKLGALVGSAAEDYLREGYEEDCEVIAYDGNTDAMREVETGKLDGTLQDTPIASFYAPSFPELRAIGEPVGEGYYVIFAREGEEALIHQLNEALIVLLRKGDLERIYRKYGIWDENQNKLFDIADQGKFFGYDKAVLVDLVENEEADMPSAEDVQRSIKKHGFEVVTEYSGTMIRAAGLTVILSVLSFPLAIAVGMLVALGRLYGPAVLRAPLTAYVEIIRGTPLMVQLYFLFFFLPELGVNIPAFWTGVIGLAVNYSAYEAEIYRAGLQAVPTGQMEAASALGMTRALALRRIVVPQAARIVIPPVVSDFIALFKDTSVCSVITLMELTKRFSVLSMSTQATIELMIMTAVLYMAMSYPLSLVARRLEARLEGR